ncbi:bifunctional metallophosphatase/5'-nucleotidase [Halococcus hamelinensis]|uniref:5'-nucleotidase n=1 Tax=Halococcus hamelinensis 100A6 TaxID=1132509 RepID=M0LUS3_9EURY|nr:5'-nucleotidase C-terminal domain-containing protein [Halococcus hamelinensis]EMA36908.1 5'-nucleotidase [Halococcus hamelinensis 100A6]
MTGSLTILGYSDLEGIYDEPESIARLGSFLLSQRDDETLVVGAGDNTALGVAATVSHNKQGIELPTRSGRAIAAPFYRIIEPDIETFGNHDLDHGPTNGKALVRDLPTGWTCGNLHDDDGLFGAEEGVQSTRIFETGAGRVGVFGVTTTQIPEITPNASTLQATDPIDAAQKAAADLREQVDYVIGVSHCGRDDPEIAAAADADIVVGGHRHKQYAGKHDGTLLVRTGGTGIVEATTEGEYTFHDSIEIPPHQTLLNTYTRVREALGLDDSIAQVDEPIIRDRETLTAGESRLGNFVADAYRAATDADVGVMHASSLRSGAPLGGNVSAGDVISVSPFGNRLTTLSVSGAALREAFVVACPSATDDRWHLSVSGASIVWDDTTNTFQEIRINDEPLSEEREYTLAIQKYFVVANAMSTLTEGDVVSYHGLQYDNLVTHANNGGLAVGIEDRIIRRKE